VVPLDVTRLGRFQILKHLATGGMAEVLLAHAQGPYGSEHVVIKRVRRDQAQDPQFVKMFMDEATLAASLQHPNIVRVHEIGTDQGEYFFAMEYVHGEDLRRVLMEVNRRRDKLPIALVTGIVAAAAAGLEHAHNQRGPNGQALGIVHRDVSPANILVGYDGQVKVADFGIAKAALRTVETQSGTLKGKVSYMSPEQVTGRPVDRRSDVYALGIVLYEVVTARRLFKGENDFLTMSSIVQGDIPLPSLLRPDLPRILEDIVMKALSPSPKDRYQSAEELRVELEKFTHAIGMRMSNGSIADYMRKLFGVRAQPWLTDTEPTHTTTIDFDGSASGLVQPSQAAVQQQAQPTGGRAGDNSPIAMSRRVATPRPVSDAGSLAAAGESSWIAKPPTGTGSGQPLAWSQQQPPPARRRFGIVLGMTAVAVVAGVMILIRSMNHEDSDAQQVTPATEPVASSAPTAAAGKTEPATAEPATAEPAQPTTPAPATAEPAPATTAETAAAEAAAKTEAAAKAAEEAKAAKAEAARLAKVEAAEKAETAAKAAAAARAEKAEAARLARAEKAEAAATARAEKAEAARLAKAERAEAARLAKAEAAAKAAKAASSKPVATRPATTKPATTKPAPKSDDKWDPNSLFPK